MPANLTPMYREAEDKYKAASTPLEKLLSQDQKIFTLEPYLPKTVNPDEIPDETTALNQRERVFSRLLELFLKIKTVSFFAGRGQLGEALKRSVDGVLANY